MNVAPNQESYSYTKLNARKMCMKKRTLTWDLNDGKRLVKQGFLFFVITAVCKKLDSKSPDGNNFFSYFGFVEQRSQLVTYFPGLLSYQLHANP